MQSQAENIYVFIGISKGFKVVSKHTPTGVNSEHKYLKYKQNNSDFAALASVVRCSCLV